MLKDWVLELELCIVFWGIYNAIEDSLYTNVWVVFTLIVLIIDCLRRIYLRYRSKK